MILKFFKNNLKKIKESRKCLRMIQEIKLFDEPEHFPFFRVKRRHVQKTSTHDVFLFFFAIVIVSSIVSTIIILIH